MAITVKKKSLKIKTAADSATTETALTDLPNLSGMPPVAMMGGTSVKKASGEYLVTGILGIVALIFMIGLIALQFNEMQFYSNLFIR